MKCNLIFWSTLLDTILIFFLISNTIQSVINTFILSCPIVLLEVLKDSSLLVRDFTQKQPSEQRTKTDTGELGMYNQITKWSLSRNTNTDLSIAKEWYAQINKLYRYDSFSWTWWALWSNVDMKLRLERFSPCLDMDKHCRAMSHGHVVKTAPFFAETMLAYDLLTSMSHCFIRDDLCEGIFQLQYPISYLWYIFLWCVILPNWSYILSSLYSAIQLWDIF